MAEAGFKRANWFCKVKSVVYEEGLGRLGPGPKFDSKETGIREKPRKKGEAEAATFYKVYIYIKKMVEALGRLGCSPKLSGEERRGNTRG